MLEWAGRWKSSMAWVRLAGKRLPPAEVSMRAAVFWIKERRFMMWNLSEGINVVLPEMVEALGFYKLTEISEAIVASLHASLGAHGFEPGKAFLDHLFHCFSDFLNPILCTSKGFWNDLVDQF